MKKYSILCLIFLMLSSCESFLDTDNYTEKNSSNFPVNPTDVDMMLTSIYSCFNQMVADDKPHVCQTPFYIAEIASDERLGGGARQDLSYQTVDHLMNYSSNMMQTLWKYCYQGIYRTNMLLENADRIKGWESDDQKNQKLGEAYFLRGLLYQNLAQIFGEAPLFLTSKTGNAPKNTADELYASIASDYMKAIEIMPNQKYDPKMSGHATKYIAQAFLARVYLFYTGYYKKESMPMREGGNVTKDQVIAYLEDCIDNSGYGLVSDFRNLWGYTNPYTVEDYNYTKGKGLKWETDVNKEIMYSIKFNTLASWQDRGFSNMIITFFGIRGVTKNSHFPVGLGWGSGTVNPTLWEDWKRDEPNDMRREASIFDAKVEFKNYKPSIEQYEETGYWQKKYIPIWGYSKDDTAKKNPKNFPILMYGAFDNPQISHARDLYLMRFSDVLLMHSELTQTADKMNLVRARVGLPPVGYSFDNIVKERRYELAFEGIRWFDIMRWGIAADLLEKQAGVSILNSQKPTTMKEFGSGYKARYNETGGFWPIPQSQIELSNGVLKQNKGWGTPEAEYTGW